jgi:hypothetical protein
MFTDVSKEHRLDLTLKIITQTTTIHIFTDVKSQIFPWRYSSDEPWPAEQPPLAVFPHCTRQYWVDMWSAHRIPQLHFQLSKPDRYFFIQVTTQFIRSRG